MNAPCKDCAARHENCHAGCGSYQEFRAFRAQINLQRARELQAADAVIANGQRLHRTFLRNRKKGRIW